MSLQPAQFSPYISPGRINEVHQALGKTDVQPPESRDHIVRMVAGTRVPAQHLKGITSITSDDPSTDEMGADAVYAPKESGRSSTGTMHISPDISAPASTGDRDYKRHVLAHEIGHHQQHAHDRGAFLDQAYSGPHSPKRGKGEAQADNYAITNTTPKNTPEHPYEHEQAEYMGKKGAQSYNAHRKRGTMP
jgi:hypothetical protein